jgi:hypothetical protein
MSRTLVVVPCGKAKIWDKKPTAGPKPARDAYTGAPFKVNREYAERFGDEWVVLSAKYGFLRPTDLVEGPYNITFKQPSTGPIEVNALRRQISDRRLDQFEQVIALGGKIYQMVVEQAFAASGRPVKFPFAGAKLGEALRAAKQAIAAGKPY